MSVLLQATAVSLIQGTHRGLTWFDSPTRSKGARLGGIVFYGVASQTFAVLASSYFTASTVLRGCVLVFKAIRNQLPMSVKEDLRVLQADVSADGRRAIHLVASSCAMPIFLVSALWPWTEPSAELGGAWKSMLLSHVPELSRISFPSVPKKSFVRNLADLASSKFLANPRLAMFQQFFEAQLRARGIEPQHFYRQMRLIGVACAAYACVGAIFLPSGVWYPTTPQPPFPIWKLLLALSVILPATVATVVTLVDTAPSVDLLFQMRRPRPLPVEAYGARYHRPSVRQPVVPPNPPYQELRCEPGISVLHHVDGRLELLINGPDGRKTYLDSVEGAMKLLKEFQWLEPDNFLDFVKVCCNFPRTYGTASIRNIAYVVNRKCWVADVFEQPGGPPRAVTFTKRSELEDLAQELIEKELDRTYQVNFDLTCGPGVVPFPKAPEDTLLSALSDLAKGTPWQAATELLVERINNKAQHLGVPGGTSKEDVERRRLWYDELETYLRCNVKKVCSFDKETRVGAINQILCGLADANKFCGGAWYDQAEDDYIRLHPEVGGEVSGWSRLRRYLKAEKLEVLDRIANDHYNGDVHRKKHLRRILAPRLDIARSEGVDVFFVVEPSRAEKLFRDAFLRTVTPSRMLSLCHEGVKTMKREHITALFLAFPTDFITQCAQASWDNKILTYGPKGISADTKSKLKEAEESSSLDNPDFEPSTWVSQNVLEDGYPTRWGMMLILKGMYMIEPKNTGATRSNVG